MWPMLLLGLLVASLLGWFLTWRAEVARICQLERSNEEIQVEETLVFDFLHGLGAAFTETIRASDLHRLIVEGAARILDAQGGALYVVERGGTKLAPAYVSKGCPPLIQVPDHILQQAATVPLALDSFLRTQTIHVDEGVIGQAWQTGQPMFLADLSGAPELANVRNSKLGTTSVMVTPLVYGKQNMGVLVLGNGPANPPFTASDFVVFKSIGEQSAFALYTAVIYSEANEKKRLDHDLRIAREIQRILLPAEAPKIPGFEISGLNIPANQVSGDYFDYIAIDQERLGVAIADVSGKGVPASLIMAICRSVLRSQAPENSSPSEVLKKVNRQLYPDIREDMFISMAYLVLDHVRATITMSRAGHDAPLLYRSATGELTPIKPPGLVLGIDSGSVFDRITGDFDVRLEKDDCLILYTDGVTEALDASGDEYGLERTMQSIRASAAEGPEAVINRIIADLRVFVDATPQNDDITLIAIRKT
ncbi:MAG: SpoIIE family protein phosphatase [Chthoniobacterales bacterium]|nr:SpoIIE family protein phosphatase [Chthoniobacterales bacterium]